MKLSRRCRRYYEIQPKSQDCLIKIQYFCNFSLVSLITHWRSRRDAQRLRKGDGCWSRPPKSYTRWSRPPTTFACFIRSSPADVKRNKQTLKPCRRQEKQHSRECLCKNQNGSNYRLEIMPIFVNHPGVADIKIQPKSPEFLLDMRYCCNFSLVSLGIRPRSRRCAERTRECEGGCSRPPKPALEQSYLTENSSSTNRILKPRRKTYPDRIPEIKNEYILM